jgi:DNA mismatch repair protein MutL
VPEAKAAMPQIAILPDAVVNRIAAGEVVERPASVLKELLENSIDSGATCIDVTVEEGGIALVRVADNGHGMPPEELPLAVTPHATSKLRNADDLERIGTLGFRGEALASIGEVSRLVIRSRVRGASSGGRLEIDGGRGGEVRPEGCGEGTSVEVHQLFGNVPARRAFLRTPPTEWSHLSDAFVRIALAHSQVALSLTHGSRRVYTLPAVSDWRERILAIYGHRLGDRLLATGSRDEPYAVEGFIGRPEADMASGRLQHLFLGGRPFRNRGLLHAVGEAYRGVMLSGRHPIVFLRLDLPPEAVDVNVHPAKMEVRFREPSRLYRLVLASLRSTLLAADLGTPLRPPAATSMPPASPAGGGASPRAESLFASAVGRPGWSPPASPSAVPDSQPAATEAVGGPQTDSFAVQMHDRYLVVESPRGIEVIDQHALHERVLFERLRAAVSAGRIEVQPLLVPEPVELGACEYELVMEQAEALAAAGLRVEPFSGTTVIVTSRPTLVGGTSAATLLAEVAARLAAAGGGAAAEAVVEEILHGLACRAAIKAGDRLSQAEVDALVRDRTIVESAHHCPHGRPTTLTLTTQELDRQFRRS